jgi:hypothetical protein
MSSTQEFDLKKKSEEVFSSERREDYWAIIVAILTLIACYFFPNQIYNFFKTSLYW